MIRLALESEQLGYERIFFTDHLMNPYAKAEGYAEETVETWALISYLAARTSSIRLGTAVTPMALRPPALLAKQVATIDRLSGGRIDLGIGTGWSAGSFGAIDTDFGDGASRRARLREGIELILSLWGGETVQFDGRYYSAHDAVIAPKPLQQPHPPLWIGGRLRNMLTLTAELGAGWIPWNPTVEFYREARRQIVEQAEALGRAGEIVYGVGVMVVPERLAEARTAMSHTEQPNVTLSSLKEWSERYEEAGAELLAMLVMPPEEALEVARHVARELM
jgi:probable F420-dependent oxidoreductase